MNGVGGLPCRLPRERAAGAIRPLFFCAYIKLSESVPILTMDPTPCAWRTAGGSFPPAAFLTGI